MPSWRRQIRRGVAPRVDSFFGVCDKKNELFGHGPRHKSKGEFLEGEVPDKREVKKHEMRARL